MDDFTSAFLSSFNAAQERADKRRAFKAQQGLADLLTQGETESKLVSNPNAALPANSNFLSDGTSYTNRYDYKPVSQNSLTSLISQDNNPLKYVETPKTEPYELTGDRINSLIAKGLKMGLDYSTASKMVGDYATRKNDDYQKKVTNDSLDLVLNAKTPADQKKAFVIYAQKTGKMDANTLKGLISTDTVKYDDGANINFYRTDSFGNPVDVGEDGKPVAYYSIAKQMSPSEKDASARGWEGLSIQKQNADRLSAGGYGRGGGSSGGGSSGQTNSQKMAMYKWAAGYELQPTGETDMYGKPVMTRVQRDPELAKQLRAELYPNGETENPGDNKEPDNSGGGDDIAAKIQQAKAAGYSDSDIAAYLGISIDDVRKVTGGGGSSVDITYPDAVINGGD